MVRNSLAFMTAILQVKLCYSKRGVVDQVNSKNGFVFFTVQPTPRFSPNIASVDSLEKVSIIRRAALPWLQSGVSTSHFLP